MALDVTVGGSTAQAYGTIAVFETYCASTGRLLSTYGAPQQEAASIRACQWLDAYYQRRWPGKRKYGRGQARAWPRVDAIDAEGNAIDDSSVPMEVLTASFEVTYHELMNPFSLSPSMVVNQQKVLTEIEGVKWSILNRSARKEDNLPTLVVVDRLLSTIVPLGYYRYYKSV